MQTAIEQSEHREQHNGLDRSLDTPNNGSGFFAAYVRPYLGYAATFAAGAVIGAHYFSAEGSTDSLEGRGKGQSRRASGCPIMPCYVNHPVEFPIHPSRAPRARVPQGSSIRGSRTSTGRPPWARSTAASPGS